jgi:hypothetical protein
MLVHPLHVFGHGNVGLDGCCDASAGLDRSDQQVELILSSRSDHDLGAFFGEKLGGCPADAAAGPCDECHFVVYVRHGRTPV